MKTQRKKLESLKDNALSKENIKKIVGGSEPSTTSSVKKEIAFDKDGPYIKAK